MAKETIDAIREVEKKADLAEKKAQDQAVQIIEKAKKDAVELKKSEEAAQRQKAELAMQEAQKEQDAILQKKMQEIDALVANMQKDAQAKKTEAVEMILNALAV